MKNVKTKTTENTVVLALYPHRKGIAYACMESPTSMIESRRFYLPALRSEYLNKSRQVLQHFCPDVVILEDYECRLSRKQKRIQRMIDDIERQAKELDLHVSRYGREQIQDVFRQFGAVSKNDIAQTIAKWLPEYKSIVPKPREFQQPESSKQPEFDAISLAYAHYFLSK